MAFNYPFVVRILSRTKFEILRGARAVSRHRGASLLAILSLFVAAGILPLVAQQTNRRAEHENERDSAALIRKRADWFFKQRAYPLGYIPAGARIKAIRQMEAMQRAQGPATDRFAAQERSAGQSFGTIPPLSTTNWTSIGPQPTSSSFFGFTSGRVNAIAVDPCDATGNTVYIAGAQGGVWKTTNAGSTWSALTDSQPSLAGGSLALDPVISDCTGGHTGAIYFGTGEENFSFDSFYGAGVLTSHDGGANWTKDATFVPVSGGNLVPQSAGSGGPFIGSLSVDPATSGSSQVLLAGIQGVSTALHSGVYRSTDGGNSWTMVLPTGGSFDYGTGVAFDPGDSSGQTAYAALGVPFVTGNNLEANNGLWRSTNCGTGGSCTWTRVTALDNAVTSAGLSTANYGRMSIALAPATSAPNTANTTIVVAIADISTNSSNLLGTFISTNGGTSFAQANSGPFCNAQCFYDISIGIDPANPSAIFLGGGPNASATPAIQGASSVIFSGNSGANFSDVSVDNTSGTPIHVDTHAFAFAHPSGGGTIVYVGDDGGVWSSSNVESNPGGPRWNDLNTNLSLTQFYPGNSIHPSNPQVAFAGAQDNGTQKFDPTFNPSNQQETHDLFVCGDGGWTALDPSTPSTVYAACEAIGQLGTINKNQFDGEPGGSGATFGQNWLTIDTPAIDNDALQFSTDFVPPLVLDSSTPQNLYFGTYRVWQSTNGGLFWTPISGDLTGVTLGTQGCGGSSCVVTTMAVAPTDSSTVYVGTDVGRIWVSANANMGTGATFTEIDNATTPGRSVTQIIGSPASNKIAYVTFSGFASCSGCDGKGHVFKFDGTVGNGTFTNIGGVVGGGGLPDIPVNDIVLDPNDPTNNTLYVATDVGVFQTTNGGTSWNVLGSLLPHVECTSLKLNNTARVLLVGTHGRGDWELQLAFPGGTTSAITGISPTGAAAGAPGGVSPLTVNGFGFTNTSTVSFNRTAVPTSFVSANQLTATVPAAAIAASAVVPVAVSSSSGSVNFSVEAPLPTLSSVTLNGASPVNISSTANPVTLTVNGSNFAANTSLAWTPTSGSQNANTTLLAQNAGGTSTSFTVTVPATLLQSTVARLVPTTPSRRPGPGPRLWLLAAFFAAVAGILLFTFVQRKRRLILGTTLATVIVLLSIAGCGGGSSSQPPPGSVIVAVNAFTPGPGGGVSLTAQSVTVQ
ncbi:MAG TPA: hypothetical protein VJN21_15070 [Candidatus Acidoferrales bacterium]|nr:hypothetical protein [Candidatus Acidoferrales bacterium]